MKSPFYDPFYDFDEEYISYLSYSSALQLQRKTLAKCFFAHRLQSLETYIYRFRC